MSLSQSLPGEQLMLTSETVLQKYYPPDFDPSKIVRSKAPKGIDKKLYVDPSIPTTIALGRAHANTLIYRPTVRLMAPLYA